MVRVRHDPRKSVDLALQGYHPSHMMDLAPIRRLARIGATDRAWAALVSAGLDQACSNDRVLTLKGRLLKDRAMALSATHEAHERDELLGAAADAYAAAAQLTSDSYPRINAAAAA